MINFVIFSYIALLNFISAETIEYVLKRDSLSQPWGFKVSAQPHFKLYSSQLTRKYWTYSWSCLSHNTKYPNITNVTSDSPAFKARVKTEKITGNEPEHCKYAVWEERQLPINSVITQVGTNTIQTMDDLRREMKEMGKSLLELKITCESDDGSDTQGRSEFGDTCESDDGSDTHSSIRTMKPVGPDGGAESQHRPKEGSNSQRNARGDGTPAMIDTYDGSTPTTPRSTVPTTPRCSTASCPTTPRCLTPRFLGSRCSTSSDPAAADPGLFGTVPSPRARPPPRCSTLSGTATDF